MNLIHFVFGICLCLLITEQAATQSRHENCSANRLIHQSIEIKVNKGNISQSATIHVDKLICTKACYLFDTNYLYIISNPPINNIVKQTETKLNLDTTINKRNILSNTIGAIPEKERNCVTNFTRIKTEQNNYSAFQSIDKQTSVIVIPISQNELAQYGFTMVNPAVGGISLVRSLNKYYYIKENSQLLSPLDNGEIKEYDFATDFYQGIALVGDFIQPGKMNYYIINNKGVIQDNNTYESYYTTDDFFILKRSADSVTTLLSRRGILLIDDLDKFVKKNGTPCSIVTDGKRTNIPYLQNGELLEAQTGLSRYSTVLGDYVLMSNKNNIYIKCNNPFTNGKQTGNLFVTNADGAYFMINTITSTISTKYKDYDTIPNYLNYFKVRTSSGRWNFINANFEELLPEDYDDLNLNGSNLVASRNERGLSARFTFSKKEFRMEGYYDILTQYDLLGYGFWAKKINDGFQSGLYRKNTVKKDTFPSYDCILSKKRVGQITTFSGFTLDKVAVIGGSYIGKALINVDKELLLPFDCDSYYETITLNPYFDIRQCTVVKYRNNARNTASFLVHKGKKISGIYTNLVPFSNSSLFKIPNNGGLSAGLINSFGKELVPPLYYDIQALNNVGFIQVDSVSNGAPISGLIDTLGKWIASCKYLKFDVSELGFIGQKLGPRDWNIIDFNGKKIKTFLPYKDVKILSKSYLLVTGANGLMGVCSWNNKMFLDTVYSSISWEGRFFHCTIPTGDFKLDPLDENGSPLVIFRCVSGDCGLYKNVLTNRNKQFTN